MTLHRSTCIPAPEFSHRETEEPVPTRGTLERLLLRTEQTGWSVVYRHVSASPFPAILTSWFQPRTRLEKSSMDVLSPRGEFRPLFGWLRLAGMSKSRSPLLRRGSTASCLHYVSQDRTSSMIACMTEGVRRCQFATSSRSASGANTYGNRDAGAIPAHRFVPAWRVGVLDLLDRRAAEHGQSPPIRRSARRSHRPKPAFRKVILDGDRRSDGRYLEISASSCAEGATWTGGGHRPMVLDRLLRQRLVPMCPGVILYRTSSSAVLRTRGAGTSAHQQARPRRRSIAHLDAPPRNATP